MLLDKVVADTTRIVQRYVKAMERADYPTLLFEIENYARIINSLFTQFKPHDDRHPEESRRNALYSSFYVLKNLMIMLYPFVPTTMERLRESLRLPRRRLPRRRARHAHPRRPRRRPQAGLLPVDRGNPNVRTPFLVALAIGAVPLASVSATADSASTIRLSSDESLSLPAQVTYVKEFEPLPPNLSRASLYRFPGGAILSLNVEKPQAGTCSAVLDRTVKEFEEAKNVPGMSNLFKFSKAERRPVGKHLAFYTEGATRTAAEAQADKPFHPVVSYNICLRHGWFSLTMGEHRHRHRRRGPQAVRRRRVVLEALAVGAHVQAAMGTSRAA